MWSVWKLSKVRILAILAKKASMSHSILGTLKLNLFIPTLSTFFFATFGLFTLKSGPHIWLVMCVGMGTCGFSAGLFMGVGTGTDSHTRTLQNEPQIIQNSQVLSEI